MSHRMLLRQLAHAEPHAGVVQGSRVLMRARSMNVWRAARRTCGCASSSQMAISCARCSTSSGVFSPASCARTPVILRRTGC